MIAPLTVSPSPSVSEALATRRSIRAFLPDPVPEAVVREMLEKASRAASGGNLQPWKLYVLAGEAREALVQAVRERVREHPLGDGPEYAIYPLGLGPPWKDRQVGVAREMYEILGIDRHDKVARDAQMNRNFEFFGAPVGMILTIDKIMGPPQFCDLGILLQSLMLLAREKGLHTCPQEAWCLWGRTVREVVGVPDDELIFCGLALGYADPDAPINRLRTERAGVDEFAELRGF